MAKIMRRREFLARPGPLASVVYKPHLMRQQKWNF